MYLKHNDAWRLGHIKDLAQCPSKVPGKWHVAKSIIASLVVLCRCARVTTAAPRACRCARYSVPYLLVPQMCNSDIRELCFGCCNELCNDLSDAGHGAILGDENVGPVGGGKVSGWRGEEGHG